MRRFFLIGAVLLGALLTACGQETEHNVLFIGNSYTHFNNMPDMVEEIAGANGVGIDTTMIAPGGAFLHEHVANPEVVSAIQSGEYDTVILQEQSVAPSVLAFTAENTMPAARSLDTIADNAGVRVIWFQTWGHVSGFPSEGHNTYESMQLAINTTYDNIGRDTGAPIARVGEAFSRARTSVAASLYHPDGTHPSPAGSYLAAIEITEAITFQPVIETPTVDGVDEATAEALNGV